MEKRRNKSEEWRKFHITANPLVLSVASYWDPTWIQEHSKIQAMARVTAGLRWPPETPPLTRIPIIRAKPHPKQMDWKSEKNSLGLPVTTWAMDPHPRRT